jgi:hypothetical protein
MPITTTASSGDGERGSERGGAGGGGIAGVLEIAEAQEALGHSEKALAIYDDAEKHFKEVAKAYTICEYAMACYFIFSRPYSVCVVVF